MKEFERGAFSSDELIEMGHGNLENGIETVKNEGWEILEEYFDQGTGVTYYTVEREIIDF